MDTNVRLQLVYSVYPPHCSFEDHDLYVSSPIVHSNTKNYMIVAVAAYCPNSPTQRLR